MGEAADFDSFERATWQGRAQAYERGFARVTAHTVEPLLNTARVNARTRLLDVGCGPGPVTTAALARGAQVTSVDADLDMVEVVARRHADAHVRVAALPELPFADEEFDAVAGNFVINHTGDPVAAVAELYRVLRPGGSLALTCWSYPGMRANAIFGEATEAAGVERPDDVPEAAPFAPYAVPDRFTRLLTDAGLSGTATDTVGWRHVVDPAEWWDDVLAGTVFNAAVILRQPPATVARIRAEYDRIVAQYATADGTVALPADALLAHGTR